ncbi:MAG TPA: heme-binding protein, partial [Verrucomicrobiae bacterium]|nr:heme-binding protein [Verrucomicrobiae bacterium]
RSAANFRKETSAFEDAIKNGRISLVANPELLPLQGGVPIVVDGQVVGAVGVAGANSAQQDTDIARAAAVAVTK